MTYSTDFRALCAELLDALEPFVVSCPYNERPYENLLARARAALAAPQQPSDEELCRTYSREVAKHIRGIESVITDADRDAAQAAGLRAVLARYGAQAAPVPVAERLPGPGDCAPWTDDAPSEPWCWFGRLVDDDEDAYFQWIQCWPKYGLSQHDTHWLPHYALPLPEATQ